jgi:hypothetical protein
MRSTKVDVGTGMIAAVRLPPSRDQAANWCRLAYGKLTETGNTFRGLPMVTSGRIGDPKRTPQSPMSTTDFVRTPLWPSTSDMREVDHFNESAELHGIGLALRNDFATSGTRSGRCHDSGVRKWIMSWVAARQKDPVPILLTIGGCVISVAALVVGLNFDARDVMSNVVADLILIGPALFLSNIIVKRIQDARARGRIAPLFRVVAQLLHRAVLTAKQALDMLGVEAPLDMPSGSDEGITLGRVEATLAEASTLLDTAIEGCALPPAFPVTRELTFPRFGMIRKLVQQADQSYPAPRSVAAANIAEDWAERCGVDFVYLHDGTNIRRRHVGLSQVEGHSKGVETNTCVSAESYLEAVRGCLHVAHGVARRLAEEAPTGLLDDVSASPMDIGRTATDVDLW